MSKQNKFQSKISTKNSGMIPTRGSSQTVVMGGMRRPVGGLAIGSAEGFHRAGQAHHTRREMDEAKRAYLQALTLQPEFPEALSDLGALLMDMGELELAKGVLSRAIELKPGFHIAYGNLGSVLSRQGDMVGAIDCLRKTLEIEPEYAPALSSLGFLLDRLGNEQGALTCYRLALRTRPDMAVVRFNMASHLLAAGNFKDGWREFEMRWEVRQFSQRPRNFSQPQWRGEEIAGSAIYLYSEQGLGDTIQFVRYAQILVERGAEVWLLVQPLLFRLLKDLDPRIHVVAAGTTTEARFDWHCPLMSLPGAMGTDLESIPGGGAYLRAEAEESAAWAARIGGDGVRVGMVWSGNPQHTRDRMRSIELAQFEGVLGVDGVRFYSLQKGPGAAQLKTLEAARGVVDLDAELTDFAVTAAVIANLDVVITVDTAVAHVAGALGKPVWILLHHAPDWRWLRGRADSPWYPTARLYRQTTPGAWGEVLDAVRRDLVEMVAARA